MFPKTSQKSINKCPNIINRNDKHKYTNMNAKAFALKAQIKLHKANYPICPIFNYGTAPVYKIEKLLAEQPQQHMKLRYTYSLNNSLQCAQTINNMSFETNRKIMSLNITDLYTNIPI
jgi:hypothetical protein